MDEDIFAALTSDKAVALGVIEPLHSSLFHCVTRILVVDLLALEELVAGRCLVERYCLQRLSFQPDSIHIRIFGDNWWRHPVCYLRSFDVSGLGTTSCWLRATGNGVNPAASAGPRERRERATQPPLSEAQAASVAAPWKQ